MVAHGRAINRAAPTARVLVVASPCNTNCLLAMTHAQDVPKEHWFALNQVVPHAGDRHGGREGEASP